MKRFLIIVALAVAGAARAQDVPPTGTEGGPCYGNHTCNQGLRCDASSDQCTRLPPAGTEGGPCYGNHTCNQGLTCDASAHCETARPEPTPAPVAPVREMTPAEYPVRYLDRPMTLPQGMIEAGLETHREDNLDYKGLTAMQVSAGWGARPWLEVLGSAHLQLSPWTDNPPDFAVGARMRAHQGPRADLAPDLQARIDFGGGQSTGALTANAGLRIHLSRRLALTAGDALFYMSLATPKQISLRLAPTQIDRLKRIAASKGLGYQTMLRMWITERAKQEEVA